MNLSLLRRWFRGIWCSMLRRDHCAKEVMHYQDGRIQDFCGICGRHDAPERVVYD